MVQGYGTDQDNLFLPFFQGEAGGVALVEDQKVRAGPVVCLVACFPRSWVQGGGGRVEERSPLTLCIMVCFTAFQWRRAHRRARCLAAWQPIPNRAVGRGGAHARRRAVPGGRRSNPQASSAPGVCYK